MKSGTGFISSSNHGLFYKGQFFNDAGIAGKFINDEKYVADIYIDGALECWLKGDVSTPDFDTFFAQKS